MKLSCYMNTDAEMPLEMAEALLRFEVIKSVSQQTVVTLDEVRAFLSSEYSDNLADSFKLEYLLTLPATAADVH